MALALILLFHMRWWYLPLVIALIGVWCIILSFRRLLSWEAAVDVLMAYVMFFVAFALVVAHWL